MSLEEFVDAWHALVVRWVAAGGGDAPEAAALLDRALREGLEPLPEGSSAPEVDAEDALRCEIAVVRRSGEFDTEGYVAALGPRERPIAFFCRRGWRRLLHNPRRGFDTWWYWREHLDPARDEVDPFLHHLLVGRHAGLPTLPVAAEPREPTPPDPEREPRRVCLFAGFDPDGIVDASVVDYVAELSRHADVYYLADCAMAQEELDKLAPHTRGAWAVRHRAYDFGSYAMLARDLVGWDVLEEYDEVVLANDSCYLVRPLDEVFTRMAGRACDWWGLQATKADFLRERGDRTPVPLDQVRDRMLAERTFQQLDHLHVSSYFLVLRGAAVRDPEVRRLVESVVPQPSKWRVVLTYEIGLSRVLAQRGFRLDTFLDDLYPYHPLYSADWATVLERGLPLLKRNLLSENPRGTADLARWKERLTTLVPDAPVEVMEANLLRVAADDRLRRSLAVVTGPHGEVVLPRLLDGAELEREDRRTPTFDHWWAFPVCPVEHVLCEDLRAVFEEVRHDPSVRKVVLTRSRRVDLEGENLVVVPLLSPEGQHHLLRAGQVFVTHSLREDVVHPLSAERRHVVHLGHGVPLRRFGWAVPGTPERREELARDHLATRAVVTSSRVDSLARSAAMHPLSLQHMWDLGLPRTDLLLRAEDALPEDLRDDVRRLRASAAGRRLVLVAPGDDAQAPPWALGEDEATRLRAWLSAANAVLGVREPADLPDGYARALAALEPLDLSARRFPHVTTLLRVADALVTDDSSRLVDFLATGRPVVRVVDEGAVRPHFHDLDEAVPGRACRTADELVGALEQVFEPLAPEQVEDDAWRRRRFFDRLDDDNARRVVTRVKALYVRGASAGG